MVDHARLEAALAEFAQLLLTDFEVPDVLQRLCEHAVDVLPVFGAGVSLAEAGELHVAWATGPDVPELESLQRRLGQGPCLQVLRDGTPMRAEFPADRYRWPTYTDHAVATGLRSLAAVPLRARGRTLGVLDVYSAEAAVSDEELAAVCVLSDTAAAYLLTARDRQARQLAEDELRLQALHDPLTGLPNRLLLLDRLRQALAASERHPGSVAVLFLDLDRFKQVNDAHGHAAGDRLLVEVARRLSRGLRPADTLSRQGGDEFVVLCEDLHLSDQDPAAIGQRLLDTLAAPVRLPEGDVVVRASVGVVQVGAGDTPEHVLRDADAAMYRAKRRGGGLAVSDRRSARGAATAIRTEAELLTALEQGQLQVFYQPVVPLRGDVPSGVEALVRWQHPTRGLLTASQFLPTAEQSGLIGPVGLWVLAEVCRQLPDVRPPDPPPGWFVSVNVSGFQIRSPQFAAQALAVLAEHDVDPGQVMVEVTETALISEGQASLAVLRHLVGAGVRVAIDDFGTGYSSLAYLKHLPATTLKIDKLFVQGLGSDARDLALVRGAATMGHQLGLTVIAEGIETDVQHNLLLAAGCDAAQGFLYGRPRAADHRPAA